jgi:hypothetical protein
VESEDEGSLTNAAAQFLQWAVPRIEGHCKAGAPPKGKPVTGNSGIPPKDFRYWRVHPKVSLAKLTAFSTFTPYTTLVCICFPHFPATDSTPHLKGRDMAAKHFYADPYGYHPHPTRWGVSILRSDNNVFQSSSRFLPPVNLSSCPCDLIYEH